MDITIPGILPTFFVLPLMSVANFLNNGMEQYYVFQNAMTMKKRLNKLAALVMALVMVLLAAACSSPSSSQSSAADPTSKPADQSEPSSSAANSGDEKEPADTYESITLDVFNMGTTLSGEQTGWFGKLFKDRWNLVLNVIPNDGESDAKFQTLSASGDLGDIVIFTSPGQNFQQAMKAGGLLYDLSTDDALYNYMPYFVEHFPVAVERMKSFSDDGGMYGIPTRVSMMDPTGSQNAYEVDYGIMIRYDYYMDAGAPELNTLEDLIPCFEAMKSDHPETEDGKPTYAASLHSGMDNPAGMAHAQTILGLYGYSALCSDSVVYVDSMAENYQDVLQEDDLYMRGLLDPDSLTQTNSDTGAKFAAGQVFYSNWYWEAKNAFNTPENVQAGVGYAMAPLKDQKISSVGFAPGGTNGPVVALGADCKDVERALTFPDWAYTPDGVMTLYNGPEGLTWEYDDKGMPYLTDFGKQALPQNNVDMPEEWGGLGFFDGFQNLSLYPLSNAEISPDFGEAYKYANWSSTLSDAMSNLDKKWSGNMDDAEFENVRQEMTTMAKEMGYDTLVEYYLGLLPDIHQAVWTLSTA